MNGTLPAFWLGALVSVAISLAVIVLAVGSAVAWLVAWLSRFASIDLKKDKAGGVVGSVEIRK